VSSRSTLPGFLLAGNFRLRNYEKKIIAAVLPGQLQGLQGRPAFLPFPVDSSGYSPISIVHPHHINILFYIAYLPPPYQHFVL
jgi:hypothetical protein